MTTAIIFPGQGSQAVGMGQDLFSKYPEYIAQANEILGFDIRQLCLEGPAERLNSTDKTQCAIFVVNALHFLDWKATSKNTPEFLLGHSIGEYNAMLAAEMISFHDALHLVKLRGELMAQQRGGAMAAVMKIPAQQLTKILRDIPGGDLIDIANYNSEYQTVVSADEDTLDRIVPDLQNADALVVRLNTSGAFHSRYMKQARDQFQIALTNTQFDAPQIPVISNVTASLLQQPELRQAEHLTSPVKWYQSVYYVLNTDEKTDFIECGWGSTLRNILRYNRKEFAAQMELA